VPVSLLCPVQYTADGSLLLSQLIDFIIKFMEDVDKVCIIQSVGFSLLQTPVVTTRRKSAT